MGKPINLLTHTLFLTFSSVQPFLYQFFKVTFQMYNKILLFVCIHYLFSIFSHSFKNMFLFYETRKMSHINTMRMRLKLLIIVEIINVERLA